MNPGFARPQSSWPELLSEPEDEAFELVMAVASGALADVEKIAA